MGRKLDLTGLTDGEAAHVLQVVQRDMRLRKKEEERLSELKQELDEEGTRCLLLSKQTSFNRRCCIRCCSPFSFLLNPKRQCSSCRFNVCKACRVYHKRDKVWLCSACQKSRLLKALSLEWFYSNVKKRFKRFGSAKVLKTLYRKHLAEHSALSELTDGSACDDSVCNEGSVCGSDSTFYRQTEEHTMAEMLSVATRVAQEAIEEAISKAEADTSTQEKQKEILYLHEHRAELVQELAKTIVEKIISRRKTLAEMKAQFDQDWSFNPNMDLQHQPSDQDSSSLRQQPNLWRSHSAFSLLDEDQAALIQESSPALQKEGAGSPLTGWKSVDRLDNAVLKSPDGNWLALQTAQMSRPGLLAKRRSLVFSALEKESGVKSAYEVLDSDNETKPEPDWGAVLQEIHRKMTGSNLHLCGDQMSPPASRNDSEGNWKFGKPLQALLKKKVPAELRKPSSSRRTSIIDVNFNLTGAGEEDEEERKEPGEEDEGEVIQSQRSENRASAFSPLENVSHESSSDAVTSDLLTPGGASDLEDSVSGRGGGDELPEKSDEDRRVDGRREGREQSDEEEERFGEESDEEEMTGRLYRLVARSSLSYFSSTEEELDREEQSDEEWSRSIDVDMEEEEKRPEEVTFRLCRLEKGVGATRFSSTEDELDRSGTEEERLSMKVCRLVNQINAAQFSSTEDELDRAGVDEEETDEGALWTQPERDRLRDLASLVSASQFSSTEDELDRAGENEGGAGRSEETEELWGGAGLTGSIDMKMFDIRDEDGGGEETFEGNFPSGEESEVRMETEKEAGPKRWMSAAESDEEDLEFDRIISSMLMMTLEDMRVETMQDGRGADGDQDNGLKEEDVKVTEGFRATSEEAGEKQEAAPSGSVVQNPAETPDVWQGEKLEGNPIMMEDLESSPTPGEAADSERMEDKQDRASREEAKCFLSPEEIQETYSAASLRSITTEVLKVLNATEELLQRAEGGDGRNPAPSLPPNADPKKLDQQFCQLEESVYVAASAAYSLEAELGELEECARGISSSTPDMELSFLEERVAAAAAKVQHSELQICDISTRIAALKSAGLNVDPRSGLSRTRSACDPAVTLDSSRQLRRRLPATPVRENKKL
ncbi:rab effector MyRIP isoform X2 [Oryzias melastigma]|uniref:Myosin VIIA and Rab interacting protein a n=1 Tax=Oryzias melastigma TaxID=30732 RepID=A0A3B3BXU0_ORYME|nr:rab effector MyRIP isoform X2 [Oryzias melastigma]